MSSTFIKPPHGSMEWLKARHRDEEAAPLDLAFMDVLSPLSFSIGGALTGLAAGGAAKRISQNSDDE